VDDAFEAGGPIFAFTGAEGGDVTRVMGAYATPIALARSLRGTILFMECRFFAESAPFGLPESLQPAADRIGLLSVEQILSDYTALLTAYRDTVCGAPCERSPIVTFGGSLAGTCTRRPSPPPDPRSLSLSRSLRSLSLRLTLRSLRLSLTTSLSRARRHALRTHAAAQPVARRRGLGKLRAVTWLRRVG
jgi:hypothetical protein